MTARIVLLKKFWTFNKLIEKTWRQYRYQRKKSAIKATSRSIGIESYNIEKKGKHSLLRIFRFIAWDFKTKSLIF